MMHLVVNTATNAAVKEFDCLAISRLIRTKAIFNAYTIRPFRLTRAIALAYAGTRADSCTSAFCRTRKTIS